MVGVGGCEGADGLERLLDFLKSCPLGKRPLPDAYKKIDEYHVVQRRINETTGEYIVREANAFEEMQRALERLRGDRSSTSLRDVARCVDLIIWLHDSPFFMARAKKKQAKREKEQRGRAGAAKRQWTCECGRVNAHSATRCVTCRRTRPKSEADMPPLHPLAGALLLALSFVYWYRLQSQKTRDEFAETIMFRAGNSHIGAKQSTERKEGGNLRQRIRAIAAAALWSALDAAAAAEGPVTCELAVIGLARSAARASSRCPWCPRRRAGRSRRRGRR